MVSYASPASHPRRYGRPRRGLHLLLALLLGLGSLLLVPPLAHAEDDGTLTLAKGVTGWDDGHQVDPGETFDYVIVIGCSNGGSGGCTNAVLTDPLPTGLVLAGAASDITIQPNVGTASVNGNEVEVTFTEELDDPPGSQGLKDGATVEVHIPVRVDPDISADLDGQNLTNTASVEGSNTNEATDDFTVVPNVPTELEASTAKSFDPDSAVADPGTTTTLTLTGGNESNVAVDEIVLTDPSGDPPGAFGYLGLTSDTLDVTLPDGAEQVQVDCWVNGSWVDGSPNAPPAELPGGVDPADCQGLRIHFISTDGQGIPPGESGTVAVELEQRNNIADAGEGPINNEVSTTVTLGNDSSEAVTADDDYTITSVDLPLEASKSFDPDTIAAGSTSTVTLGATNSSDRTLDSLSITEPGGDPNIFENGLTFNGWTDGVKWPTGATGASVTYTYDDGSTETITADGPDSLPDPPDGKVVTGFTVEFTGPIVAGAEATIPFEVVADETQGAEVVEHPNTIGAESSAPGGYHGEAEADDTLTTIEKRLAVEVDKKISPDEIFSIPGQEAIVELTGKVSDFPESTTDAHQIIVQDPADLADDGWYDAFAPKTIAETPIPDGATLTVQYWDGTQWIDVPGMVGLEGPQIFTGDLPPEVQENAQGIRFVYDSEDGFPPGTTVNPNIVFELKPDMAGQELTVENCASSAASTPEAGVGDAAAEQQPPDCPAIDLIPPDPGNADFIEKDWDSPKLVGERSQEEHGASLRWSTSGATGVDQMRIYDVPDPTPLPDSVYDSFDLVRIDPITPALDPLLTYDRVTSIRLFSRSADAWIAAPDDPCPAACDGTFPGYTLTAEQRADIIGFALMFEESPTRADRIGGNPTAPRVGSGVARSAGNNRTIHPVFQIRDVLRSDPAVPVIADEEYNVSGQDGEVRNTVSAEVWVDDRLYYTDRDSDIIVISPVPLTSDITKDWDGGPLGVPAPGTATFPDEYPTGRVNIDAHNTTPRKVDRLTITEPTGGTSPFDEFNLRGFTAITAPEDIGATDVVITLQLDGGGTRTLTRDEALAATEAELSDVVGFAIVYTGRIEAGAHALVGFDTRLRETNRETDAAVTAPATIQNEAKIDVEDLIDFPTVGSVHHDDTDDAAIELTDAGIGLEVTKTITPATQTEPDRSPVTVRLTGQPEGPSRTNWLEIVDEDYTFFNQYDFVGFNSFAFTAPIDQVQVDAYVGGTFEADGDTVNRVGGAWVNGEPGTALTLPDEVTPADVIGLRFTFTKADGTIWENPSTPLQAIEFQVQRRETLRTGGPVQSDLTGNGPAPGEANAGEASDTIQGENRAADTIGNEPLTAHDEATDTIVYQHARNSVTVTKSPNGAQPPGGNIPYRLTFTNTGDVPIIDPVITDHIPSDADGPMLVFDPDRDQPGTGYTYDLTGAVAPDPANGPAMPTDPADVTVSESPDTIRFTFPAGTVLEVGQTYTITLPLQFRPGLPGNTDVTNTVGITGDRPWDECEESLDDDSGECQDSSTVHPVKAGSLSGQKSVKAADDDDLGVLNTRNLPDPGCVPDANGFYRSGCVPITKPGSDEIWRMTFTNTGNLPQDRVYAIDRLPIPGDTGVITGDRGSQWRPIPKEIRYAGVTKGTVSEVRIYYDTDQGICTDDLVLGQQCPDGEWTLLDTIAEPTVGGSVALPANATAIKIEADFFGGDHLFQPTGTVSVDLVTTTPAQSPTAGPDTIAWNNVTVAARNLDRDVHSATPATEGNKVGVALATGPLRLRKDVTGPAAQFAPDDFALTVECTSVGEEVDLGDKANVTITADEIVTIDDLPWGSECTVSEDTAAAGNPEFSATTVVVVREDQTVPIVIATNVYPAASLVITKSVEASAVDEEGNPLVYGPFVFEVECTYLDQPVYATDYGSDDPMTASFSSGESVAFTGLPAGASCTATETDDDGADSTTSVGTAGDADPITGTTVIGPLVLAADGENELPTNEIAFTNTFAIGSLTITKEITGSGAEAYGTGPFFVQLTCVDARDTRRVVFDGETQLGGGEPLSVTVENLYVDSICRVTETGTGGATGSTVSPAGSFRVTADSADDPVQINVTNRFDIGALRVVKKIVGDESQVDDDQLFRFELSCELIVNGEPVELDLGDDAEFNLSIDGGLSQTFDGLPTGAVCTVTETDNGGADSSIVQPEQVTIGVDSTVDVLATNTFDPPPTSPSNPNDRNPLADTGGPTLLALLAGLVLLAAGGTLLRYRRRQR